MNNWSFNKQFSTVGRNQNSIFVFDSMIFCIFYTVFEGKLFYTCASRAVSQESLKKYMVCGSTKQQKRQNFSAFSLYHDNFVDCAKIKKFQWGEPSTDQKLSFKILMYETLIFMDRWEFEYKDFSELVSFLGVSRHSDAKIQVHHFSFE